MISFHTNTMPARPSTRPVPTDQRSHKRASTRIRAVFKPQGSEACDSIISNISLSGAWLEMTDNQPAIGSAGKLHVIVADVHLYLIAKVIRQTQHGVGVTFIDMGIESYENLKRFVEELYGSENANS